jgi:uncharacterized protein (TIGR00251 family)
MCAGFTNVSETVLKVRVIPRAKRSGVDGMRGDAWLIRLQAPPVDGAANEELISVLAKLLDVPKRAVTIVGGERAREKRVHVAGIDAAAAQARLSTALS